MQVLREERDRYKRLAIEWRDAYFKIKEWRGEQAFEGESFETWKKRLRDQCPCMAAANPGWGWMY